MPIIRPVIYFGKCCFYDLLVTMLFTLIRSYLTELLAFSERRRARWLWPVRVPSTSVHNPSWPSREDWLWSRLSSMLPGWFTNRLGLLTFFLIGVTRNTLACSQLFLSPSELSLCSVGLPRYQRVLICEGMDHYTYLVGLVYPLILIGCCTVYAFQTRKCPGAFNEARYIGFTTYTTCVLWMAFIPLFLTAPTSALRIVTLAMSLSIR